MSNEKYNNTWQDELDQLSSLPGEEATNYAALWDAVETRLHAKKNKKTSGWYWIAAACIISILFTIVLTSKDKRVLNIQPIVQNKKENKEARVPIIEDVAQMPVKTKLAGSEKNITHSRLKKQFLSKTGEQNLLSGEDKIAEIKTSYIDTSLSPIEAQPVEKSRPIVFTKLRKKLPVVHLNDLEAPLPVDVEVAENRERPGFRVRLFTRDMLPTSASKDNGLKVKLSPQN